MYSTVAARKHSAAAILAEAGFDALLALIEMSRRLGLESLAKHISDAIQLCSSSGMAAIEALVEQELNLSKVCGVQVQSLRAELSTHGRARRAHFSCFCCLSLFTMLNSPRARDKQSISQYHRHPRRSACDKAILPKNSALKLLAKCKGGSVFASPAKSSVCIYSSNIPHAVQQTAHTCLRPQQASTKERGCADIKGRQDRRAPQGRDSERARAAKIGQYLEQRYDFHMLTAERKDKSGEHI